MFFVVLFYVPNGEPGIGGTEVLGLAVLLMFLTLLVLCFTLRAGRGFVNYSTPW